MSKGNQEIRFRADHKIHSVLDELQSDLGLAKKSTGAAMLIHLGNERIKDVVAYLDSITHPLSDTQFQDLFLTLKIKLSQLRDARNQARIKQK